MVSAREGLNIGTASFRRVAIRVDSSAEIGSGHLRRCLALAGELRARGAKVDFVCRAHPGNFNHEAANAGFGLLQFPLDPGGRAEDTPAYAHWLAASPDADAASTAELLGEGARVDTLIVDHYGIDARWEKIMRRTADRILVIDDLADREHDCDVLLDTAPGEDKHARYSRLAEGATLLIGPRFALLRPEFARAAAARSDEVKQGIHRIVMLFGAVDPDGFTGRAAAAVRRALGAGCELHLVLGATSPQLPALRTAAAADPALHLHVAPSNVAEIFGASDIAVISAGVTAWECAAIGIPSIVTPIVDNQRAVAEALTSMPCALAARVASFEEDVAVCARTLANQPSLRRLFARNARAAVDGKGAGRVARAALPDVISLRLAEPTDSRDIWSWRNDERVRRTSRNAAAIEWADHEAWFARAITDQDRALLVARCDGDDVAVVRFDLQGSEAEISIYLTPGSHGRGLGVQVLHQAEIWLAEHKPGVKTITAFVRAENDASRAAFTQAGYSTTGIHYSRQLKATHGQ